MKPVIKPVRGKQYVTSCGKVVLVVGRFTKGRNIVDGFMDMKRWSLVPNKKIKRLIVEAPEGIPDDHLVDVVERAKIEGRDMVEAVLELVRPHEEWQPS